MVIAGGSASMDITILEHDSSVVFKYVDENGDVLTDIDNFQAYAFSVKDENGNEFYSDYAYADGADGQATLSVADGITYEVTGWMYDDSFGLITAESSTSYMDTYESVQVVGDVDNTQTVTLTLREADSTIEVTVLDVNGNPTNDAWVDAIEQSEEDNEWGAYVSDTTDANGLASLDSICLDRASFYRWIFTTSY